MIVGSYLEEICQTWNFLLLNYTFSIENSEFSYFRPTEKKNFLKNPDPNFWYFTVGRGGQTNIFFLGLMKEVFFSTKLTPYGQNVSQQAKNKLLQHLNKIWAAFVDPRAIF